jgi:hypothetical protein
MTGSSATACGISRRTILLGFATGGAVALAAGRASALEMSPVKVSKDSVHYQAVAESDHRCGACKLFVAPSSCVAVSGEIGPDCGCRIWLPKAA